VRRVCDNQAVSHSFTLNNARASLHKDYLITYTLIPIYVFAKPRRQAHISLPFLRTQCAERQREHRRCCREAERSESAARRYMLISPNVPVKHTPQ
jgi:hypothetical protein